jgi:hypothetical protein
LINRFRPLAIYEDSMILKALQLTNEHCFEDYFIFDECA